ncbi:hypothetical protein Lser_V15G36723 [Lactuca serriola]
MSLLWKISLQSKKLKSNFEGSGNLVSSYRSVFLV